MSAIGLMVPTPKSNVHNLCKQDRESGRIEVVQEQFGPPEPILSGSTFLPHIPPPPPDAKPSGLYVRLLESLRMEALDPNVWRDRWKWLAAIIEGQIDAQECVRTGFAGYKDHHPDLRLIHLYIFDGFCRFAQKGVKHQLLDVNDLCRRCDTLSSDLSRVTIEDFIRLGRRQGWWTTPKDTTTGICLIMPGDTMIMSNFIGQLSRFVTMYGRDGGQRKENIQYLWVERLHLETSLLPRLADLMQRARIRGISHI